MCMSITFFTFSPLLNKPHDMRYYSFKVMHKRVKHQVRGLFGSLTLDMINTNSHPVHSVKNNKGLFVRIINWPVNLESEY